MDKKLFKRLVDSMGQMDEIVRGVREPSREYFIDASKVKEIRAMTGLSQPRFARLLHVDVGTLRNWEQGVESRRVQQRHYYGRLSQIQKQF